MQGWREGAKGFIMGKGFCTHVCLHACAGGCAWIKSELCAHAAGAGVYAKFLVWQVLKGSTPLLRNVRCRNVRCKWGILLCCYEGLSRGKHTSHSWSRSQ